MNRKIVLLIVVSQVLCTSMWFAVNAVASDMAIDLGLSVDLASQFTSVIQFGFIMGTLVFAIFSIADRFLSSKVFMVSALLAAFFNTGFLLIGGSETILVFRFLTGFFLAGIYPVGMKIAADYFQKGLGKTLGFLVGALVLGTALPHFLKAYSLSLDWRYVFYITSGFGIMGGLLIGFGVPKGPYAKPSTKFNMGAIPRVFKDLAFRKAAFGYFGHMWELYTFWALVPLFLTKFYHFHHLSITPTKISVASFLIIAGGSVSCSIGGYLSQKYGPKKVAIVSLIGSFLCCLAYYFVFQTGNETVFLLFLGLWGLLVIADSPMFSTLVAKNAPSEIKGTALTIVNSLGFTLTIVSIASFSFFQAEFSIFSAVLMLSIGPFLGIVSNK